MKKIKFTIENKTLNISYKIENNTIKNINNTNIISDEDLIFDIKYFKNNKPLIAGFLNVLVKNDDVKNAIIEESDLIIPIIEFLDLVPNIENLVISPDIPIDYNIHMAILKNSTLKRINCFTIPPYLLENIDSTKDVKLETRNEVFFISNFIRVNKLNSYSDVFYKRKLNITYEFNDSDWEDFKSFMIINAHLKTLYFEYVSLDLIKKFIEYMKEYDRKSIVFSIKGSKENLSHFKEIEELVKKNKTIKKNNIKFRIDYTKDYKIDNFWKLLNMTTLKYIFIVVFISAIIGYGINAYDIYKSETVVDDIQNDISEILEEYEEYDLENVEVPEPDAPEEEKPKYISPYYKDYSQVISVLKNTNKDTVGWLRVNNTSINYPVVQSSNDSYYLNHDFNKNVNSFGWIFMDYRNDANDLDQNTIIFGHNISQSSGVMFGSLRFTLNASWYNNESNRVITFNTANSDMKWQIFSIYKIAPTNDYMYTNFDTKEEFIEFANKLKNRSIKDFDVDIEEDDKIITLSTCQSGGRERLVVHAKLIK